MPVTGNHGHRRSQADLFTVHYKVDLVRRRAGHEERPNNPTALRCWSYRPVNAYGRTPESSFQTRFDYRSDPVNGSGRDF